MATCKDCIHYEPCYEFCNILDPIHGGVICDSFKPTADVVPKSEVVSEIFEEIEKHLFVIAPIEEFDGQARMWLDDFERIKKKYTEDKT